MPYDGFRYITVHAIPVTPMRTLYNNLASMGGAPRVPENYLRRNVRATFEKPTSAVSHKDEETKTKGATKKAHNC